MRLDGSADFKQQSPCLDFLAAPTAMCPVLQSQPASQQFGGGHQPTAFNTPAPAPAANPHNYPPPPQYYPHQGGPPPQHQDRPQVRHCHTCDCSRLALARPPMLCKAWCMQSLAKRFQEMKAGVVNSLILFSPRHNATTEACDSWRRLL